MVPGCENGDTCGRSGRCDGTFHSKSPSGYQSTRLLPTVLHRRRSSSAASDKRASGPLRDQDSIRPAQRKSYQRRVMHARPLFYYLRISGSKLDLAKESLDLLRHLVYMRLKQEVTSVQQFHLCILDILLECLRTGVHETWVSFTPNGN